MDVRRVGPGQLVEFLELAYRVRSEDPAWIAPLTRPLLAELAEQEAASGPVQQALFLCVDGTHAIGRIGALIDQGLTETDGSAIGQIGYFECIDDRAAAMALMEAACAWLVQRGATRAWGPMCGGAHRPHRFMTAGYDQTPFLLEPRNPAYYPIMFERAGFSIMHEWHSYDLTAAQLCHALLDQLQVRSLASRARKRYRLEFPPCADPAVTLPRLYRLLDALWSGHVGYAPLEWEEFSKTMGAFLTMIPQGYLGILAQLDGGDVGMALMYPDYFEAVQAIRGDETRWGHWRNKSLPARIVLHTTAVSPEARGHAGVALFLEDAAGKVQRDGYTDAVIALVDREKGLRFAFARPTRTYALFERSLP